MNGISYGAETESIIRDEEDERGGRGRREQGGTEGKRSKAEASNSSMLHNRLMDADVQWNDVRRARQRII